SRQAAQQNLAICGKLLRVSPDRHTSGGFAWNLRNKKRSARASEADALRMRRGFQSLRRKSCRAGKGRRLHADAVFGTIKHPILASMAIALVRHAFRQALLSQLVPEVECAGNYAESDAGPHEYQERTPDIETHISGNCLHL